ncbi:MAG: response regulator [Myxococcota bacterium]|nr:response regulator [Myxococcota bacterium]
MSDAEPAVVLVVDDERGPRESLRMILEPDHEVVCARSGTEALEILRSRPIDLVTLDLNMPGMQGEELMRILRQEHPSVEVIIITGYGTLENATEALRAGIADYLQKPFDVVQVSASIFRTLERRRSRQQLAGFLESLGEMVGFDSQASRVLAQVEQDPRVSGRIGEMLTQLASADPADRASHPGLQFLEVLAETVESQSPFMRGHARRTALYAGLLAERLGLSAEKLGQIRLAGFLHDIGKIGVPTELLLRAGALTPDDRGHVEKHPEIGANLVAPLSLPSAVVGGIRHHHEWWDGRGYGDGLYGEQIPVAARIVALADAYDAMSCDRPYRRALAPQVVAKELDRYAGVQFDPRLAKEFLSMIESSEDLVMLADPMGASPRVAGARA